ncbi:MAG: hypothetical protein HC921_01665 [Synechococcaceae cyanobacterium SM2_3_1]|nr:hypothetical protein [Synechococcaceae cyanobacterium SM2_3_1]
MLSVTNGGDNTVEIPINDNFNRTVSIPVNVNFNGKVDTDTATIIESVAIDTDITTTIESGAVDRDLLGRLYRALLEPACFAVGSLLLWKDQLRQSAKAI